MEPLNSFTYDEWRRTQTDKQKTKSELESASSSEEEYESEESDSSDRYDNTHRYVPTKAVKPKSPQFDNTHRYVAARGTPAEATAQITQVIFIALILDDPLLTFLKSNQYSYYPYTHQQQKTQAYYTEAPQIQPPLWPVQRAYHQSDYVCYPVDKVPVAPSSEISHTSKKVMEKDKGNGRVWEGRTKAQVDEDNFEMARREGVYKYTDMKPKDAKSSDYFWVIELDKTNQLYTFKTIDDEDFGPGKWERDPRYGNAFFVRENPKDK